MESERDAIPLALIMLTSPLTPLATLNEIRSIGFSYLPSPEEIVLNDESKFDGLSKKMTKVLKATSLAQRSGSRYVFEQEISHLTSTINQELELADYNISQLYQLISLFTSVLPASVVSVLLFIAPSSSIPVLYASALLSIMLGSLMGIAIYPWELSVPSPPVKSYIPMLAIPAIYVIAVLLPVNLSNPLTFSLAVGSVFAAIVHWIYLRRFTKSLKEARDLVSKACNATYNVFRYLGISDPLYLLSEKWAGIGRAATISLYLLSLHGSTPELINRLENYIGKYLDFYEKLNAKTRIFLLYAIIEAVIIAATYAIILVTAGWLTGFSSLGLPFNLTADTLTTFRKHLDVIFALNSLALAGATASARHGKPHLLTLYLPFTSSVIWIGYIIGQNIANLMIS